MTTVVVHLCEERKEENIDAKRRTPPAVRCINYTSCFCFLDAPLREGLLYFKTFVDFSFTSFLSLNDPILISEGGREHKKA